MLTLTRIVTALYGAAFVALVAWKPDQALQFTAIFGTITAIASGLANALKDGTIVDAIANGLAVNVTAKTTVTPPPAGTIAR